MKIVIQKILAAGSIALLILLGGCCHILDDCDDNDGRYTAQENFDFTIDLENQTGLAFAGVNGVVTVTGWDDTAHARVQGTRIVRSHSEADAWTHLKDLQVVITEGEKDLNVATSQPAQSNGREYTINYVVSIPKSWSIALSHVNGNVRIAHIRNTIDMTLTNGETILDNHRGGLDIIITNGSFTGQSELPADGAWTVMLANGSIDLVMPQSTSAEFSAAVTNGSVEVNGLALRNRTQTSKFVTGVLGGGAGKIALAITNGQIEVNGIED